MGKTETIKKRRVDVYLKSEEQKDRWNKYAKKQKTSLSKSIMEAMEAFIGGGLLDQLDVKERLTEENKEIINDNNSLKVKNRRLEKYIEILEMEMNREKNITFSEPGPGFRCHNEDLVRVLKTSKYPVSNQDILGLIKVNHADTELVKSISNQLEALASYKLIKYTNKGWIWNG